jgi:uncharacterized DUF497 family protein
VKNIIWDKDKNEKLILERDISFEEISQMIMDEKYIDIIENPVREGQLYFVVEIREYTWIIPFLIDEDENIVLKTAFPSRKYYRKYKGEENEERL